MVGVLTYFDPPATSPTRETHRPQSQLGRCPAKSSIGNKIQVFWGQYDLIENEILVQKHDDGNHQNYHQRPHKVPTELLQVVHERHLLFGISGHVGWDQLDSRSLKISSSFGLRMISVRRFFFLPAVVSFESMGRCSPRPAAIIRCGSILSQHCSEIKRFPQRSIKGVRITEGNKYLNALGKGRWCPRRDSNTRPPV